MTDINPENPQDAINELKNGTMITLENETGYSVTDFRMQIGGQSKICSLDGWFKDGETAKLDLKKLGNKEDQSVKVSFMYEPRRAAREAARMPVSFSWETFGERPISWKYIPATLKADSFRRLPA